MIRKTRHPSNRGERLAINKKKVHDNASPVYLLLKEKEENDVRASRLSRNRTDSQPQDGS